MEQLPVEQFPAGKGAGLARAAPGHLSGHPTCSLTLTVPLSLAPPPSLPLSSFTYRGGRGLVEAAPEYQVLNSGEGENLCLEIKLGDEEGGWERGA